MVSKTEIVNKAYAKIGADSVANIETDNTKISRLANRIYDTVRDTELAKHYWKFAKTRTRLAPLVGVDEFEEWAYRYQLPSDFIQIFSIEEATYRSDVPDYEIEGQIILTDIGDTLDLKYIKRVTDTAAYHPLFVETLSIALALQFVESITESNTKKEALMLEYRDILRLAKRMDALQEPPKEPFPGTWVESRYGGD